MKTFSFIAVSFLFLACAPSQTENSHTEEASEPIMQNEEQAFIPQYDGTYLDKLNKLSSDSLYIFNFWATWCGPCVKELPDFIQFASEYQKDVPLYLEFISLDFPEAFEEKLPNFVERKLPNQKVVVLYDPDMNTWIPKVSDQWSGAIPATLIVYQNKPYFLEGEIGLNELKKEVDRIITS